MRILIVTRLFPIPGNIARGTFVSDHVELLKAMGHDIKVVNLLPRIFKFQEARRSTLEGVSKAPKFYNHGGTHVEIHKHLELRNWPLITTFSVKNCRINFRDWQPEVVISHTLWPVGVLAQKIANKYEIPLIGIVHGYDFDITLKNKILRGYLSTIAKNCDRLIVVSNSLIKFNAQVIPCHVSVENEWLRKTRNWNGQWRNSRIEILFPSDPRRPEKNYVLCLKTGSELESRGWQVEVTVLQKQPRTVVWDRMLTADVTLITSIRESGPLVAKEAIVCGCPVVGVNVGDLDEWLPKVYESDPIKLADAIEEVLGNGQEVNLPSRYSFSSVSKEWKKLLQSL